MNKQESISVAELNALIGLPDWGFLIDVRIDPDFVDDPRIIPTARRHSFLNMVDLIPQLINTKVVIYCQKGKKIGQGASALLRSYGINSAYLEGGQFAWRDMGMAMLPFAKIPLYHSDGATLWVTGLRPNMDSLGCLWLIKRFIDPKARCLFVEKHEVVGVAEKFSATVFGMDETVLSHPQEKYNFDRMLKEFTLTQVKGLMGMAKVIRDINPHDHSSSALQSSGMLALYQGMTRIYKDDLDLLSAMLPLFDALYQWSSQVFE